MFTFLITLIIIVAILLILVVLIQRSQGGGLSSQFGGAGAPQLMGIKKTNNLLEQITWGLAIALFLLILSTSLFLKHHKTRQGVQSSPNIERAQEQNTLLPPVFDLKKDSISKK